jgi:hypothetical protein
MSGMKIFHESFFPDSRPRIQNYIVEFKKTVMKNLFLAAVVLFLPFCLMAQNPAVEKLFDKYQGKDGFTTVLVTKDAFKVLSDMKSEEGELDEPLKKINEVKILVEEDEDEISGLNFYDELKQDMNFTEYKELIVVKEKDQDVWIIARENEGRFSELLVIVGGEDNVLIWVEGDFTFEELAGLSEIGNIEHLEILKEL